MNDQIAQDGENASDLLAALTLEDEREDRICGSSKTRQVAENLATQHDYYDDPDSLGLIGVSNSNKQLLQEGALIYALLGPRRTVKYSV
jgi:hypothetical protein